MESPADTNHLEGLRILGFCDYFTEASSGGVERVTLEVYRRLIAQGADVRVITAVPGAVDGESEIDGIPTRTVPSRSLARLLRAQVSVAKGLHRAARDMIDESAPDVIHASSIHFQGSITAARVARKYSIPLVTTAHVGSLDALPLPTRVATAAYERTAGRYILRSSQREIAVSKSTASHITHLGAKQVTVVSNGVDHDRFLPDPHRPDQPIEMVFVGRLIGNKGPEDALAAISSLKDPQVRVTFVGEGPMRAKLERSAENLDVAVRFAGHSTDVAGIMRSSHILVRPSQTEGQSLTILEAMASGMCVVASDIEANRELIDPGVNGFLHRVADSSDLAATLRSVLANPSRMQAVATAGRKVALTYSWNRCAAETGRVLAAAAARSAGA